jgi:hypothetical protein
MEQPTSKEISISLQKEPETFEAITHPFDTGEIQEFIQKHFPEYADSIAKCKRPGLSSNPDEFEK